MKLQITTYIDRLVTAHIIIIFEEMCLQSHLLGMTRPPCAAHAQLATTLIIRGITLQIDQSHYTTFLTIIR